MHKRITAIIGTVAMVATSFLGQVTQAAAPGTANFKFMTFAQAGYPEQDVFVLSGTGTSQVVRVSAADARFRSNLDKQAYAAASAVASDVFMTGPSPLGPFPAGRGLSFTMENWLAARGSGTYSLTDSGTGVLALSFEKLVPNGIYTVVCGSISTSAKTFSEATCIAADGSESALKSDENGKATFRLALKDLLAPSTTDVSTLVGLEYHSDGKTCDGHLCDLGLNGHVQLIAMVPTPREMTKAECLALALKTKTDTMKSARSTYLTALSDARKVDQDALTKARNDHNDAVKAANTDRRTAEATARKDRQTALDQAKSDFTAATLSASTTLDREIAKERFDAAKDEAASNFTLAMDTALTNAHKALNTAQNVWDDAKDAAQTHWDADKDNAKSTLDSANAAALRTFHASRLSCMQM